MKCTIDDLLHMHAYVKLSPTRQWREHSVLRSGIVPILSFIPCVTSGNLRNFQDMQFVAAPWGSAAGVYLPHHGKRYWAALLLSNREEQHLSILPSAWPALRLLTALSLSLHVRRLAPHLQALSWPWFLFPGCQYWIAFSKCQFHWVVILFWIGKIFNYFQLFLWFFLFPAEFDI